jgi:hypothetical protein
VNLVEMEDHDYRHFGIVSTSDYESATKEEEEHLVFDEKWLTFVRNWKCFALLRLSKIRLADHLSLRYFCLAGVYESQKPSKPTSS